MQGQSREGPNSQPGAWNSCFSLHWGYSRGMLTSPFSLQPQSHLSEETMAKAAVTKRHHFMIQKLLILLSYGYTNGLYGEFPGPIWARVAARNRKLA